MGAGDEPFGDPIPDPTVSNDPAILARPVALFFDPVARDFPTDSAGRYQALHPVDAEVDALLLHLAGKIPAVATAGLPLNKLRNVYDVRAPKTVENMVRTRLAGPIGRGDITLLRVDYQPTPNGPLAAVSYLNNRLSPKPTTPTTQYVKLKTAT